MIKKIVLIMLLSVVLFSCGKKGCPKNSSEERCNTLFKQKIGT